MFQTFTASLQWANSLLFSDRVFILMTKVSLGGLVLNSGRGSNATSKTSLKKKNLRASWLLQYRNREKRRRGRNSDIGKELSASVRAISLRGKTDHYILMIINSMTNKSVSQQQVLLHGLLPASLDGYALGELQFHLLGMPNCSLGAFLLK